MNYVMGIDPGINGGISILHQQGEKVIVLELISMPVTISDKYEFFKSIKEKYDVTTYIEKVASRPTDSRRGAFSFGKHVGELAVILWSLGYSPIYVGPKDWIKSYNLKRDKGESKYNWKKRLRDYARGISEETEQLTLKTCDAYLIALYGLKQTEHSLNKELSNVKLQGN